MTINRRIAAASAAAILLTAGATTATATTTHPHRPMIPAWMNHPCRNEESFNCYWNAHEQGNHRGYSYFIRLMPAIKGYKGPRMVCAFYPARPKRDYCTTI